MLWGRVDEGSTAEHLLHRDSLLYTTLNAFFV